MKNLLRPLTVFAGFLGVFLALKYLLPYFLPFGAGLAIALLAEPLVGFGVRYFRLPRALSTGVGVSVTLLLGTALLSVVGALAVKELGNLANALPDMESTAREGLVLVENLLTNAAGRAPEGVRPFLLRSVSSLFGSGSAMLSQVTARVPGMVTGFLGGVPKGALSVGAALLSGYMFSSRLPRLRQSLSDRLPPVWKEKYLPALRRVRHALGGWLKAQAQLAGVIFAIVLFGFLLLRISYAPAWAALVAAVDAVPILGTGTVLVPWALVCLLQGQHFRAIGLFCVYGAALLTRTALEPRLVGRHLGLDPLATLVFLYLGFRFWGLLGMLAAPVLAAAVKSFLDTASSDFS